MFLWILFTVWEFLLSWERFPHREIKVEKLLNVVENAVEKHLKRG